MIKFVDNHVELEELPKSFKKITGTRFATILGLNAWATPFEMWCAITRTYEEPFEDTIYTIAGKKIEPIIHKYIQDLYFLETKSPEDVYGPDPFKATWGDFFKEQSKIFGGMWDAIGEDFVVEIKTTKRVEDWQLEIPIYYKMQAALYAHLLGFDQVYISVTFLEDKDYANPEYFKPTMDNTKVFDFKMSEDFPDFKNKELKEAKAFWDNHVLTGISPDFDEKKDEDILRALRTVHLAPTDETIQEMLVKADKLAKELALHDEIVKDKQKELKMYEAKIKEYAQEQMGEDDKYTTLTTPNFVWTVTKAERNSFDTARFKKEQPSAYDDYVKTSETFTLRKKEVE